MFPVKLLIRILLVYYVSAQSQYCLYNQMTKYIANPANSTGYQSQKLNYEVVFNSPQNPISYSYVLMGYMGTGNRQWSFEATMTNVSSTRAYLNIYPHPTAGEIVYALFGIVILNQCGGGVELVFYSYVPVQLSKNIYRSVDFETADIPVSSPFAGSMNDYYYRVFISFNLYTLRTPGKVLDIYLQLYDPVMGLTQHGVQVRSEAVYQNIIQKLGMTYIKVHRTIFNTAYKVYQSKFMIYGNITSFLLSNHSWITSDKREKCLFGLTFLRVYGYQSGAYVNIYNGSSPVAYVLTSYKTVNLFIEHFCIDECPTGQFLNGSACTPCYNYLANCNSCSNTTCWVCAPGYQLDIFGLSCSTRCGDGITVPSFQQCDDGNNNNTDGCSQNCTKETGFNCTINPSLLSQCSTACGDGVKKGSEGCDDWNTVDGDGCSSQCKIEVLISMKSIKRDLTECNSVQFQFICEPSSSDIVSQLFLPSLFVLSSTSLQLSQTRYQFASIFLSYEFTGSIEGANITWSVNSTLVSSNFTVALQPSLIVAKADNNVPLNYIDEKTFNQEQSLQNGYQAIAIASFVILFIGFFAGKIIGLQLLGVLQLAYFCTGSLNNVNLFLSPLMEMKILNGLSFPFRNPQSGNIPKRVEAIGMHPAFADNYSIMIAIIFGDFIVGLTMLSVIKLFRITNSTFVKVANTILKEIFITLLMFSCLSIAYSCGIYYRFSNRDSFSTLTSIASLAAIILMSIAFPALSSDGFGQFKDKFKKDPMQSNYMTFCLLYRLLLGFFLAFQDKQYLSSLFMLGLTFAFVLYSLVNLPFSKAYHNYRACICSISQLGIAAVTMYYRSAKSFSSALAVAQTYEPAILQFCMISACLVISGGILIFDSFIKIRQLCAPNKKTQIKNTQISQQTMVQPKISFEVRIEEI